MEGNIIIIPILQIKKLRTCKVKWFQDHTTGNCWKEEKKKLNKGHVREEGSHIELAVSWLSDGVFG